MSRITDELDAATERVAAAGGSVAVASAAALTTTRAIAELAAGASALEVVRAALASHGTASAPEVRLLAFDRERGARAYAGPLAGLAQDEIAWEAPVEASFRGHEVFLPKGAGAETLALGLVLLGELAPAGEGDEAPNVAVSVAVARRALVSRPDAPLEAFLEPAVLDELLDSVEAEPAAPVLAPVSEGFGLVAVDREGGLCAATAGDAPSPPLLALRFGRAFLGVAGPAGPEALVLPLVRLVDRAAPGETLLDGVDALGPGDLALVVRDDAGVLDARVDARGQGAAAVRDAPDGSASPEA